jgi:hypothetical protein
MIDAGLERRGFECSFSAIDSADDFHCQLAVGQGHPRYLRDQSKMFMMSHPSAQNELPMLENLHIEVESSCSER